MQRSVPTPTSDMAVDADRLVAAYGLMTTIRLAEEQLSALFAAGRIPGFIHLSIGQEAVAAGIIAGLRPTDTIASTHRGHGHSLAKGMDLDRFFFEIFAKAGGACGGRGGSMHVADFSIGMLGANGIVGAGISLALGSALAHKLSGSDAIAAAFFGDGARAEGILHETINIAALRRLPLLLVCENNGWSEFSPGASQFAGDLKQLAAAFGVPHTLVDGNDVEAVSLRAEAVVAAMRAGGGPQVLECITQRVHGHFEGDAQKYRPADELAALGADDPLLRTQARLAELGITDSQMASLRRRIEQEVGSAVERAQAAAAPDFTDLLDGAYTPMERAS